MKYIFRVSIHQSFISKICYLLTSSIRKLSGPFLTFPPSSDFYLFVGKLSIPSFHPITESRLTNPSPWGDVKDAAKKAEAVKAKLEVELVEVNVSWDVPRPESVWVNLCVAKLWSYPMTSNDWIHLKSQWNGQTLLHLPNNLFTWNASIFNILSCQGTWLLYHVTP